MNKGKLSDEETIWARAYYFGEIEKTLESKKGVEAEIQSLCNTIENREENAMMESEREEILHKRLALEEFEVELNHYDRRLLELDVIEKTPELTAEPF
jgi:hypothetical protein